MKESTGKDFLITLLLTLPLGFPISMFAIAEMNLEAQVQAPLNLAYTTTDVSLAKTNLEKALEGIEQNQQGILTRIPPSNKKVQVWKSEIEKYQKQLKALPEGKQKSTNTSPHLGLVINWYFMLFFQFTLILALFGLHRKHQ